MKTKSTSAAIAFALCALVYVAAAQPSPTPAAPAAPNADTVAAWVQTFYDQTRTVEARFEQHFWTRVYQRTQSSRGRLRIQRPGQLRFDYDVPAGKVVVSDSRQFLFFEPGEDGAPGQYVRNTVADAAATALGFLTGSSRITRDFRSVLRPRNASTPSGAMSLELRPRRADPRIVRVVLYVDSAAATRGVVRRIAIEDPDGNWNRFDFSGFQFNRPIEVGVFHFTPPASAREMTR